VLSPAGGAWDLFGEQVEKRGIVSKLDALRKAAERAGVPVFYSRVEIDEGDYGTRPARNGIQALIADRKLFRAGAGARWLPELEPTAATIVLSPRSGPSSTHTNVVEELRKLDVETIVVAGMVANLCVEAQVREATEDDFNVVVAGDAIATTTDEALEGALGNFGLLATEVASTQEIIDSLGSAMQ
jgi:nicotinamidase-related amidase